MIERRRTLLAAAVVAALLAGGTVTALALGGAEPAGPPPRKPPRAELPPPITFERYVSPVGAGRACTRAAPCRTFEAAYAAASPGDDIRVSGGAYVAAQVELTGLVPKVAGPRVTFHVPEGERAAIDGPVGFIDGVARITLDGSRGADGQGFVFTSRGDSYVTIGYGSGGTGVRAFTIRGARIEGSRDGTAGQAIWLSACRDVLLQDIEIAHIWRGDGVHISRVEGDDACRGVVMDGLYVHDFDGIAPDDHQDAVQVRAGSAIVMRNSIVVDLVLPGSQGWFANPVGDLGGGGTGCIVESSVFAGIGAAEGGAAVNVAGCDVVVRNNTIVGRLASCTDESPACATTQEVYGNILDVECGDVAALQDTLASSAAYGSNVTRAECGQGRGDTVAPSFDAMFADALAHDYHLVPGAFAIGRGDQARHAVRDVDGAPRPQGASIDAGADERE